MYTNKNLSNNSNSIENNRSNVNDIKQNNEYVNKDYKNEIENGNDYQITEKNKRNGKAKANTTVFNIINENESVLRNYMNYNKTKDAINNLNYTQSEINSQKNEQLNVMNMKPTNKNEKTTISHFNNCNNNICIKDTDSKWNNKHMYKNSNESGQNWIEFGEATLFWDSLKNNFKNTFLLKKENDVQEIGGNDGIKNMIKNANEFPKTKQVFRRNIKSKSQAKPETIIMEKKKKKKKIPLSTDTYVKCLTYLSADKILECELINKLTSEIINKKPVVFKYIKNLILTEKWGKLPIFKRQYYLHQMEELRHLKVTEKLFPENGMYIHEVAALIFQNSSTLKSLELLSPELHKDDNTPKHEPFAFSSSNFEKLEKLTIIGCQTLEWLHILRNCSFPMLKKFEVCYYPTVSENSYWEKNFDFTILGIQGLYKVIYTMKNLYKISIGFDVLFDNANGEIINPTESQRRALEPYTAMRNENNHFNHTNVPPAYGYPSRKYRSYRGKLCEEDYSDIFSIVYYVAGKYGKLKRIMIKYKNSCEIAENETETTETINEFVTGAANTASVCYNYVVNWFRSPNEI